MPERSGKQNTAALPVVSAGSEKWAGPWLPKPVRAVLASEELPAFAVHNHHRGTGAVNGTDGRNPLLIG